jgi:hypothetical protein
VFQWHALDIHSLTDHEAHLVTTFLIPNSISVHDDARIYKLTKAPVAYVFFDRPIADAEQIGPFRCHSARKARGIEPKSSRNSAITGEYTVANPGHIAPCFDGKEIETAPVLPLGLVADQRYEAVHGRLAARDGERWVRTVCRKPGQNPAR